VRELLRLQWATTRGVEDNEVMPLLTEDLQRDLRRRLCVDLLKVVRPKAPLAPPVPPPCCRSPFLQSPFVLSLHSFKIWRPFSHVFLFSFFSFLFFLPCFFGQSPRCFYAMNPQVLDGVLRRLKQRIYIDGTVIVKEGYPVNRSSSCSRGGHPHQDSAPATSTKTAWGAETLWGRRC